MGRVIFRKIGGRMVPITISTENFSGGKKILAHTINKIGEKVKVGAMDISNNKGASSTLSHVKVEPHFRKKGVSGDLFNTALEELGKEGKKFLRSESIIHPAQVSIRNRKQTKFIGQGMGIHGDKTKILGRSKTYESVKKISKGYSPGANDPVSVKATTMIPKKFRRSK